MNDTAPTLCQKQAEYQFEFAKDNETLTCFVSEPDLRFSRFVLFYKIEWRELGNPAVVRVTEPLQRERN